jgi:proteasome assembly chaperone (PAC2) family protein
VKTTWKIIKESIGKVQSTDTIIEINTEVGHIIGMQEIANLFNTFFINIAGNGHNHIDMLKVLHSLETKDKDKTIYMKAIPETEAEVINIITSLESKNSTGFYEISSKILKKCANIISKPLSFMGGDVGRLLVVPPA